MLSHLANKINNTTIVIGNRTGLIICRSVSWPPRGRNAFLPLHFSLGQREVKNYLTNSWLRWLQGRISRTHTWALSSYKSCTINDRVSVFKTLNVFPFRKSILHPLPASSLSPLLFSTHFVVVLSTSF